MPPDDLMRAMLARLEALEAEARIRRESAHRRATLLALAGKLCPALAVLGLAGWVLAQGVEIRTEDAAAAERTRFKVESGANEVNAWFEYAKLGIGTSAPAQELHVSGTVDPVAVMIDGVGNLVVPNLIFRSKRAAADPASNVGDDLMVVLARGYDGAAYNSSGAIVATASEDWSATNNGARMIFQTTTNGTTGRTERMRIDHDGEIGINTTAPARRFHVVETNNPAILAERNTTDTNSIWIPLTLKLTYAGGQMADGFGPAIRFEGRDADAVDNYLGSVGAQRDGADNSGALVFFTVAGGTGSEKMRIESGGDVGVGTAAPTSRLHVEGTSAASPVGRFQLEDAGTATDEDVLWVMHSSTGAPAAGLGAHISIGAENSTGTIKTAVAIGGVFSNVTNAAEDGYLNFQTRLDGALAEKMRLTDLGELGVGTTNPAALLHVETNATSGDMTPALFVRNPVTTNSTTNVAVLRRSTTGTAAAGIGARLAYQLEDGAGNVGDAAYIIAEYTDVTNGSEDADYRIMTHRAGTLTDQAKIQSDGSLLVDTLAAISATRITLNDDTTIQNDGAAIALEVKRPTSTSNVQIMRLFSDVGSAGNVKFRIDSDGDIATDGSTTIGSPADVAEMYPYRGDEAPEPGTVVRVVHGTPEELARIRADLAVASKESPEHPAVFSNPVAPAAGPDAKGVIGVVSTDPALVMSGNLEHAVPVALAGRVPVKVTGEGGAIRIGDLLTTSSTPGHAMKATDPWRGGILGTALENFDGNSTDAGRIVSLVHVNPAPACPGSHRESASVEAVDRLERIVEAQTAEIADLRIRAARTDESLRLAAVVKAATEARLEALERRMREIGAAAPDPSSAKAGGGE